MSSCTARAIGDDVTFTIEVFNQGNVDANNITVIDYIPTGLTLNDADWTATTNGNATITLAGTIAAGTSVTVDVTMTIAAEGDLDSHAEITEQWRQPLPV